MRIINTVASQFKNYKNINHILPILSSYSSSNKEDSIIVKQFSKDKLPFTAKIKFDVIDNFNEKLKKDKKHYDSSVFISGGCLFSSIGILIYSGDNYFNELMTLSSIIIPTYWHMYTRGARDSIEHISKWTNCKLEEMKDLTHYHSNSNDMEVEYDEKINNILTVVENESEECIVMLLAASTITAGSCLLGLVNTSYLLMSSVLSVSISYSIGSYYFTRQNFLNLREKIIKLDSLNKM